MTETQTTAPPGPLAPDELERLDAWWRAANYLSVGQIYLLDNPLLREPLRLEHVKPRLLGHWGTTPGPELPLRPPQPRRSARATSTRSTSPARATAGPAWSPTPSSRAPTAEVYPEHQRATRRACAGCSGSSPSRAASRATSRPRRRARSTRAASSATRSSTPTARRSTTPTWSCAAWSATARPRPGRWRRAGTRTSSSTRRATARCCRSCTSTATRSPTRRCWPGSPSDELRALLEGYGYEPLLRRGRRPGDDAPALMAATLDEVARRDRRASRRAARAARRTERPRWPMIVLRTPKGWTGPEGGRRPAGRGHLPRPPGAARRACADEPRAPRTRSRSGCARYRPEELFDDDGPPRRRAAARSAPRGRAADGRQPARQRRRCCCATSSCPTSATTPSTVDRAGARRRSEADAGARRLAARRHAPPTREANFRVFGPDETASNRLGAVFEVTDRAWMAERRARRRPPRARRPGHGGALRAPVPGLAGGLPAHRPARAVQLLRGVHPHRRLDVQPARQVAEGHARHPVAAADRVAELPAVLARLAPGPQRLLPPGPGLHRPRGQQEGRDHPRLPAAGRQHACCRSPTTACAAATTST